MNRARPIRREFSASPVFVAVEQSMEKGGVCAFFFDFRSTGRARWGAPRPVSVLGPFRTALHESVGLGLDRVRKEQQPRNTRKTRKKGKELAKNDPYPAEWLAEVSHIRVHPRSSVVPDLFRTTSG